MAAVSPLIDEMNGSTSFTSSSSLSPLFLPGVLVFLLASWWQASSHRALAKLRSVGSEERYRVPASGAFRLLLCPHYSAEIVIYFALYCVRPSVLQGLVLVWTVVNLTITARKTRDWYIRQWPHHEFLRHRWCILPFLC